MIHAWSVPSTPSLQYGVTALMFAVKHGHMGIVKELLSSGAKVDHKDKVIGNRYIHVIPYFTGTTCIHAYNVYACMVIKMYLAPWCYIPFVLMLIPVIKLLVLIPYTIPLINNYKP